MAKPLANGIPIGAILMRDKIADIIKIGEWLLLQFFLVRSTHL
jgi:acetylornithine/succinyldiaminopimelate/putrescine aminotransferase